MYNSLIATLFFVFAGSAAAVQCEAPGQAVQAMHAVQPAAGQVIRASVVVAPKLEAQESDDKESGRGGTAALLVALAMMSGIALRRYTNAGR